MIDRRANLVRVKTATYRCTVPICLLLIAWVSIARAFVAPDLLWVIGALIFVAPILVVLLGATSVLAVAQHRPAEGFLTTPQFWSLLATWATIAGFGLFAVSGAGHWAESPFTAVVGNGALAFSSAAANVCLFGFGPAYLSLLVLLILGMGGRRERRAATQ